MRWLTKSEKCPPPGLVSLLQISIKRLSGKTLIETLGGNGTVIEKLKAFDGTTGSPLMGKVASNAIDWLKELFGVKPAGAAELKPSEQKRPDSFETPPWVGLIRFREEIRESTKSGIIEGLRQILQAPTTGAGRSQLLRPLTAQLLKLGYMA
jgi:hypothetical protein